MNQKACKDLQEVQGEHASLCNSGQHSVAHAPPAMVLFFLFLFLPLTFAFMLTAVAVLCKPGCAVSAADTSLV